MRIAIIDDHNKLIRVLETFVWVRTKELEYTKQWRVLNALLTINHKTYKPIYWHSFTIERHRPVLPIGATVWSLVFHFRIGDLYIGITRGKLIPAICVHWLPAKEEK